MAPTPRGRDRGADPRLRLVPLTLAMALTTWVHLVGATPTVTVEGVRSGHDLLFEMATDVDPELGFDEVSRGVGFAGTVGSGGLLVPGRATWLRLEVSNHGAEPVDLLVESPYVAFDEVTFHIVSTAGHRVIEAGNATPPSRRVVAQSYPAAVVHLEASAEARISVRILDAQVGPVYLQMRTLDEHRSRMEVRALVIGLFLGAVLLAAVISLVNYTVLRETSYLAYAWYAVAAAAYVLWWVDGVPLRFVALSPAAFELSSLALMSVLLFAAFWFVRSFLDTESFMPRAEVWLRRLPWLMLAAVALHLLGIRARAQDAASLIALALGSALAAVLVAAWRRDPVRTRFFALAWGVWAAGTAVYALGFVGLHSNQVLFVHGPRVAIVLELVLLNLALADRQDRIKKERQQALERELAESQRAARLGLTFERYVPKEFLSIMDKPSILDVERGDSVELEMSILFSDIRGFTTMAEAMGSERTFRFIDHYLGLMEPALAGHGGFINDIFGDGIMALFHTGADDAVAAALAMLDGLDRLNRERVGEGLDELRMGVGIHTGRLMLGTIGGEHRLDCTVVGDPANLAARIEGMTKAYGAALLISGATKAALEHPEAYRFRRLDRVQAKGKHEAVDIFEVLDGERGSTRDAKITGESSFEAALELYLEGRFELALEAFSGCARAAPEDRASTLFVERCIRLIEAPPASWAGMTHLYEK